LAISRLDSTLYSTREDIAGLLDPPDTAQSRSNSSRALPIASCPVCDFECSTHTVHNLSSCSTCEHIFQTDLAITVSYDGSYARQYDQRPVREMSELRWKFIQSHLALATNSKVLDVGYGNGAFLKRAREARMEIYGIDVHNENFGVPTIGFDTNLHFDLVCFFDSLEHFADFDPIFRLKADAAIVSIPNRIDTFLTAPLSWRHYKPGEHLHYFSAASLDRVMARWGFNHKLTEGFPEDELRGKLHVGGKLTDNIYTAIYTRGKAPPA
jgi:SAM-dependent methyltransferase